MPKYDMSGGGKKYTGPTHLGASKRSTAPVNPSQKSPGVKQTKGHPEVNASAVGNIVTSRAPGNYKAGKKM